MNDALTFLEDLWPTKPAAAAIQIWAKDTKKNHTFLALHAAADWAVSQASTTDVYVAAGLAAKVDKPSRVRATAKTVIGIPGLWADIDVNGGPEGKTGAAPSIDDALRLANIVLEPTTIVMSGHGIQAWWLFEEPWLFALQEDQNQAARLSQAFQAMLKSEARKLGFGLDSTHDLARLMRLPGTMNHKGSPPMAVELVASDGPRYTVEVLSETCEGALRKIETQTMNGHAPVAIEAVDAPPFERIDDLIEIDPEFGATWRHEQAGRRRAWGSSEFDMSIANALVSAGFTDQEIANAIAYHRKRHGDDKGKASRMDYISLTISKARSASRVEDLKARREAEVSEAIEVMGQMAEAETPAAPAVTVSYFHRIIGGPEIKELVQDGRDPDMARYKIVFADGQELAIGGPADLTSFERFRNRYMALTQHLPQLVPKKEWEKVVRSLLTAVTVIEDEGATRNALTVSWIEEYVENRMARDKDKACQVHDPYTEDGYIYLPLGGFSGWIRKAKGERVGEVDVRQLLTSVGFERKTVAYDTGKAGKRSSRSYYRGLASLIEPLEVPS